MFVHEYKGMHGLGEIKGHQRSEDQYKGMHGLGGISGHARI